MRGRGGFTLLAVFAAVAAGCGGRAVGVPGGGDAGHDGRAGDAVGDAAIDGLGNSDAGDAHDGVDAGADVPRTCASDTDCDDGIFCDGIERCAPRAVGADEHGCVAGDLPCIPDDVDCTIEPDPVCDEDADACNARALDHASCGEGNYCHPMDGCLPGVSCDDAHPCHEDGDPCTVERCDAEMRPVPLCIVDLREDDATCILDARIGVCKTGACCTGCWDGTTCQDGHELSVCGTEGNACIACDDGNACTDDSCAGGACDSTPNDANACPGGTCHAGACCTGCWDGGACRTGDVITACGVLGDGCASCDDGNPCTDDACDPGGICRSVINDANSCPRGSCHAGFCCTGCWDGAACQAGIAVEACGTGGAICAICADDPAPCTDAACNRGLCVQIADDANACDGGSCHGGVCCTGCWNGASCESGIDVAACGAAGDACVACDDANACTDDVCMDGTCSAVPDDANACAGGTCHGAACCTGCWDGAVCQPGDAFAQCGAMGVACAACDDGNPCTNDACAEGACRNTPDDRNACAGVCRAGMCDASGVIFYDGFEGGSARWNRGSQWRTTASAAYRGSYSLWGTWGDWGFGCGITSAATMNVDVNLALARTATLEFVHRGEWGRRDFLRVRASTDGGFSWTTIAWPDALASWATVTIDLAAYVGNPTVRFGFEFYNECGDCCGVQWYIDEVYVRGTW